MERSISINPYLVSVLLLAVAILQTSIMPSLALWGGMPDFMLLVVISWSLLQGTRESVTWALGGGLMLDLLSGGPFGAITISLTLSSLATGLAQLNIFRGSQWLPLATGILATATYNVIYLVILRVFGYPLPRISSLLQVVISSMILNGLVMYPVYWAMRWLHQHTG